jgi:hypothetical protein
MSMNRSHLKSIAIVAVGATLIGLTSIASATTETTSPISVTAKQEFKGLGHEFELETGEKLLLAHRHKVSTYRVCVGEFKGSVPLKVFADDTQSEVAVGECESVTGKHVRVEPAVPLPRGDALVARFGEVAK